jgi:molybdopterin-containing oxidoreductase family membrane subunit
MAIFACLDDLLAAIRSVREQGIEIGDVHSPFFHEEIGAALGSKRSPVRFFTLAGAILGILSGLGLAVYTAVQWHFIVSGKPPVPRVPYVIVAFEFCILLAIFFNLGGMLLLARLPKSKLPAHYDIRLTEDRFGLLVRGPGARQGEIRHLLQEAGAEEIHDLD